MSNSTFAITSFKKPVKNNAFKIVTDFSKDITLSSLLEVDTKVSQTDPFIDLFTSRGVKNALSLDLSKNSSGIVLLIEGVLFSYSLKLSLDKENDLDVYSLKRSLKEFLSRFSIIPFDLISVEETVLGSNNAIDFITLRKLVVLNYLIDELIDEGILKTKVFDRIPVVSWKSDLNYLADDKGKYLSAKGQVLACLEYLNCPIIPQFEPNRNELISQGYTLKEIEEGKLDKKDKTYKNNNGFGDRLDACGILISACMRLNKETKKRKTLSKKATNVKFDFDIYTEYGDVYEEHTEIDMLNLIRYNGNNVLTKIRREIEQEQAKVSEGYIHFLLEVKTLGDLGIKEGISDLEHDKYYIYVRKK